MHDPPPTRARHVPDGNLPASTAKGSRLSCLPLRPGLLRRRQLGRLQPFAESLGPFDLLVQRPVGPRVERGFQHVALRGKLCQAGVADVIMAPAADMFEMGVEVQVLRRGTMFAVRGRRLYELYRAHASLDELSADDCAFVEKLLQSSIADAWASTRSFWMGRDPHEVAKAEADPKHQMALLFRAYLGQSSKWAIAGDARRAVDYQIWCGPAQGAFNAWAADSFLHAPEHRTVVQVARNLVEGAAVLTRAGQLRAAGVAVPQTAFSFRPRPLA